MDVNKMRVELKRFYGDNWKKKVDKMSDSQVIAIFTRLRKSGQIKF